MSKSSKAGPAMMTTHQTIYRRPTANVTLCESCFAVSYSPDGDIEKYVGTARGDDPGGEFTLVSCDECHVALESD